MEAVATVVGPLPVPLERLEAHVTSCSPDQAHVAIAVEAGATRWMWVDGRKEPEFAEVAPSDVRLPVCVWTSAGERHAYVASSAEGSFVVLDGTPKGPFEAAFRKVALFDPTGKRFACVVKQGGKFRAFVEGTLGKEFGFIVSPSLAFTADGTKVGYAAGAEGRQALVVGDEERVASEVPGALDATVSADLAHLAVVASVEGGEACLVDGKPGPTYVKVKELARAPAGSRFAYRAHARRTKTTTGAGGSVSLTDVDQRYVVDGVEWKAFDEVQDLVFSADGKRAACVGRTRNGNQARFTVLVDDQVVYAPTGEVDLVAPGSLVFSPDGRRVAFAGWSKGWTSDSSGRAVVDGVPGPEFEDEVALLRFSGDGKHVAYVGSRERRRGNPAPAEAVVVDGTVRVEAKGVRVADFDPAGEHLVFSTRIEGRHRIGVLPVAGGDPVYAPEGFDFVISRSVAFPGPRSARLIAVRGAEVVRVEVRW